MSTPSPPATRRIWLCADDYGIAPGVNGAIRDLVAKGRLNATSVMVVAPSMTRAEAVALTQLNADETRVAIGLHLTLSGRFTPRSASFRPIRDGHFLEIGGMLLAALRGGLDPAALTTEIEAQFAAFQTLFDRAPDFVDGHQHVHLFPQVRDAVLASTRTHAPQAWVRQCGAITPLARRLGDPKGLLISWLSRAFQAQAKRRGIATNPAFAGTYTYRATTDVARIFPSFLDGLPDGSLIMCHPGVVDAELERVDPLTTLRETEYAYFGGAEFPRMLAAKGVTLV